jgi:hypothetical protein
MFKLADESMVRNDRFAGASVVGRVRIVLKSNLRGSITEHEGTSSMMLPRSVGVPEADDVLLFYDNLRKND